MISEMTVIAVVPSRRTLVLVCLPIAGMLVPHPALCLMLIARTRGLPAPVFRLHPLRRVLVVRFLGTPAFFVVAIPRGLLCCRWCGQKNKEAQQPHCKSRLKNRSFHFCLHKVLGRLMDIFDLLRLTP
jgi:hypothetical protein